MTEIQSYRCNNCQKIGDEYEITIFGDNLDGNDICSKIYDILSKEADDTQLISSSTHFCNVECFLEYLIKQYEEYKENKK